MKNLQPYNSIAIILLIAYLCIGFIPNWEAVDKIAPQWLGMNILNVITIIFIFYQKEFYLKSIDQKFRSTITLIYGGFILWAGFSYFYAINPTEVIVNISRQFGVFIMYLSMGILIYPLKNKPQYFSWIITAILTIEMYAVITEAMQMLAVNGRISAGDLKGVTANRNITAFSLAIKIPFVYYLIYHVKKGVFKLFLSTLLFGVFSGLLMIQSRASFLATGFGVFSFFILNAVLYITSEKKNKNKIFANIAFVFIPLIFSIFVNQLALKDKGGDAISRAASIGAVTTDDSITARIRYYTDVWTHLSSNPIFGVGLGNWKLKSIEYDRLDLNGYVVPYHAHSDFIQLGAELGLIGALLYLGVFFTCIVFSVKLFRSDKENLSQKIFVFMLLIALGIYSVDASLNFPIARPQVLVDWALIVALISFYYYDKREIKPVKKIYSNGIILFSIFCLVPSLYVSNSVYKSLKGQMFLLQDFNSNSYNLPLNQVDNVVPDIPNITVTTIPINSVKARYYLNAKKYDKALALVEKGTSANPYLFYSELLKSQIYQAKGDLDSAKFFARKAFFGLPNNALHASNYINLINQTRDADALEEAFEMFTAKNDFNNWKNYLIVANAILPPSDSLLISRAKHAITIFPGNAEIQGLARLIELGQQKINQASSFSNAGLQFFNAGDYKNAAIQFSKALENNPYEYSYYENAATSNYLIGNFDEALVQIDQVINTMNPNNGKCEYIKAIIFIRMGDDLGACPFIEIAVQKGYAQAEASFNQYCK